MPECRIEALGLARQPLNEIEAMLALTSVTSALAKEKNIGWLREWAFAISMFSGMLIGYIWNTVF